MSYRFDSYDRSLVIEGWENGIGDSPHTGLADMRNVNIASIPGEASVNFATSKISPPAISGIVVTGVAANVITYTGGASLENNMAISFSVVGGLTGVVINTVYWVAAQTGTTCTLYTDYEQTNQRTIAGAATGTPTFATYNMAQPKHFAFVPTTNTSTSPGGDNPIGGSNWVVDSAGQVWSSTRTTGTNNYWVFTGNTGGPVAAQKNGNGLVYYQTSTATTGYMFVFDNGQIDYTNVGTIGWTYGWNPATGTTAQSAYLKTGTGKNNSHEAFTAPDNTVYYCDAAWVGTWFETVGKVFSPTDTTTYTQALFGLLPSTDTANCLTFLGSNVLVGGSNNVIYSWNRSAALPSSFILLPEYNVKKMVTVNTQTYIFIGNRGRIYSTNGTNVQLYKKIPDHISGTVEPYYVWGGATFAKNQLYFSAYVLSNAQAVIAQYGGVWAINVDTDAIRLTNKLSYGTYDGYATAITPNLGTDPAGAGLFIGWTGVPRSVTDGVLNATTTITSATAAFVGTDVGSTVTGIGLPFNTSIQSVTSSSAVVLSNAATATATGVTLNISPNGIDTTTSVPYTGSQAVIESDLIPIGTFNQPRDFTKVEYKLTKPLVSGESITINTRTVFGNPNTGYAQALTDNTVGNYSSIGDINFKNAQWVQFQIVLNSTATTPSYTRLKQIRILGLTGPTLATSEQLTL